MPEREAAAPEPAGVFRREGAGLEFDRVSFFSDAVYAIAMTLLVVELHVPEVPAAELGRALAEEAPAITGFFIAFLVIGRYWLAHHRFFASLASIDRGMVWLNMIYLAFIAFAPFPVALVSRYSDNLLSFVIFAGAMATVSALEVALYAAAVRGGHLRRPPAPAAVRHELVAASLPVAVMLLSIGLAVWNPGLALLSWLLMVPMGMMLHRFAPPGTEE